MIELKGIAIRVPGFELRDIAFAVERGAYATLMGPTGCGKTSILEVICGTRKPQAGRVLINGEDVTKRKPGERGIGYVPQDGALFPTMTVRDQIAFTMGLRRWGKKSQQDRIDALAGLLHIGHLLKRKPQGLSGGEKQRVALGRALAFYPRVLLLDEPLSALDEATRVQMIGLLKQVREHEGITTLHVTHRSSEAQVLAGQTLRLHDGRVICATSADPVQTLRP